jgi:serine/threonine-protein kinase
MKPSGLDPERWRHIDEVFDAVLDRLPAEREVYLEKACAGDRELRAQVEALLDAYERTQGRFEEPVSPLSAAVVEYRDDLPLDRQVGPFRLLQEIGRGRGEGSEAPFPGRSPSGLRPRSPQHRDPL